jgi:hypothetical protein
VKLGAEPRKIAILAMLTCAAGYLFYANVFSTAPATTAARTQLQAERASLPERAAPAPVADAVRAPTKRGRANRRTTQEFRPSFKPKGGVDPMMDPRLRLDLLAKVQSVEMAPAERNVFQWGQAKPVAVAEPAKIIPKTPAQIAQEQGKDPANAGPPAPPPPPPITLKYYGYSAVRADGHKRAFFLDGDDIFVAGEGELVKRRYKVVRIGVNSVVVEDTQFNNTQTLPLAEDSAG